MPLFSAQQLRRLTIDELKRRLSNKLSGLVRRVGWINPGNRVFRGVKWDARPNEISQLSYPIDCSHLGRLNRKGRPMFTRAVQGLACLIERARKQAGASPSRPGVSLNCCGSMTWAFTLTCCTSSAHQPWGLGRGW